MLAPSTGMCTYFQNLKIDMEESMCNLNETVISYVKVFDSLKNVFENFVKKKFKKNLASPYFTYIEMRSLFCHSDHIAVIPICKSSF